MTLDPRKAGPRGGAFQLQISNVLTFSLLPYIHLFPIMALCGLCASITLEKLVRPQDQNHPSSQHPGPDYGGFRHYSSFYALQESALTCALCSMILYALNEYGRFGFHSNPDVALPLIRQIFLHSIHEWEYGDGRTATVYGNARIEVFCVSGPTDTWDPHSFTYEPILQATLSIFSDEGEVV